jgi:hypothetical protein
VNKHAAGQKFLVQAELLAQAAKKEQFSLPASLPAAAHTFSVLCKEASIGWLCCYCYNHNLLQLFLHSWSFFWQTG